MDNSDSDSDSETIRTWPFTAARSTASDCSDLLTALLATNVLDEIPDANDLDSVEKYIRMKGVVDNSVGRTQLGVAFWLYPSGLHGPYHDLEGGAVERHGTLITVEAGVVVNEFTSELRNRLTKNGVYYGPRDEITHEHFAILQ
ncbi:hypothetical protein AZE42_12833 [Rhizopogon vesiculosus]|uniref:Uncharacterized protein n=1 Tax=Rhizopogon vesiculosus TaxID=180088 RepID=A0A1J8R6X8_9AGAM|nr:hypothetical protein AZE42_12833 [Rhizopogon vesiculosus]